MNNKAAGAPIGNLNALKGGIHSSRILDKKDRAVYLKTLHSDEEHMWNERNALYHLQLTRALEEGDPDVIAKFNQIIIHHNREKPGKVPIVEAGKDPLEQYKDEQKQAFLERYLERKGLDGLTP